MLTKDAQGGLRVAPGRQLYVYQRGTTTQVSVYDASSGGSIVSQPLSADVEGRFPSRWVAAGSYDFYAPGDSLNPTQPWEAIGDAAGLNSRSSAYRLINEERMQASNPAGGPYVMYDGNTFGAETAAGAGQGIFYFDPADYPAGGLVLKCRLRFIVITNAVAPAHTITVTLRRPTTVGGAAGANTITAATDLASAVIATPAANSIVQGNSGDFNAPAVGGLHFTLQISAGSPAGAACVYRAILEARVV